MSITKKAFTTTSQALNAPEVLNFLQTNASKYFSSITADESGNITCKKGGSILLGFDGKSKSMLTLPNGESATEFTTTTIYKEGYVTNTGIMLFQDQSSTSTANALLVTKSSNGKTAIIRLTKVTNSTNIKMIAVNLEEDLKINLLFDNSSVNRSTIANHSDYYTTLTPIPLGTSQTYVPNVFITTFSQYPNIPCILDVNGIKYAYDGAVALKE